MIYRVDTSRLQYIKYIYAFVNSSLAEFIDVTLHKAVGVLVVAAKHDHFRIIIQQIDECIEILCRASFADNDLHAEH